MYIHIGRIRGIAIHAQLDVMDVDGIIILQLTANRIAGLRTVFPLMVSFSNYPSGFDPRVARQQAFGAYQRGDSIQTTGRLSIIASTAKLQELWDVLACWSTRSGRDS
jgi:hypothetical protein